MFQHAVDENRYLLGELMLEIDFIIIFRMPSVMSSGKLRPNTKKYRFLYQGL